MGKKIVLGVSLFIFTFTAIFPYEIIGITEDSSKTEVLLKKEKYGEIISLLSFGADSIRIDKANVTADDSIIIDDRELVRSVEFFSPVMSPDSMLLFMSPSNKNILLFDGNRRGLYTLTKDGLEKYESYFSASSFLLPALTFLLIPVLYIFGKVRGADNKDIEEIYTSQIGPTFSFFVISLLYSAAEVGISKLISMTFTEKTDLTQMRKNYLDGFFASKNDKKINLFSDFAVSSAEFMMLPVPAAIISGITVYHGWNDQEDASAAGLLWILFSIIHYSKNVIYLLKDPQINLTKLSVALNEGDLFYLRGYIDGISE
ncbi:MAG: hypothetical protein PHW02_01225 [bacterium]|nr:hypothetical protein [bacterium]